MPHPNDNSQDIRFAIFDCPKEFTEEQKQEIHNFAEHVEKHINLSKSKAPAQGRG